MSLLTVFPNLENVKSDTLLPLLGKDYSLKIVENILGNIILYPDSLPTTTQDIAFWQILFTELIKLHQDQFYNLNLKKITIPDELFTWCPGEENLAWLYINALQPEDMVNLEIKKSDQSTYSLITYIRPTITTNTGKISLNVKDKKYELSVGSYLYISANTQKVDLEFNSEVSTLFGKNQSLNEIPGGKLGLLIDARIRKND